jgi:hypothetical protein
VSTTQIYASVSIHALKAVHARCHPGASLNPKANTAAAREATASVTAIEILDAIEAEGDDVEAVETASGP